MRFAAPFALAVAVCGWMHACHPTQSDLPAGLKEITLPDGAKIQCEVMIRPEDMARGMMFRDALPEGRGMLFVHREAGKFSYWMPNVRMPLDIVWMDADRRIVEMSADTPPCKTEPGLCPHFGGNFDALTVLELPAGSIARHKLAVGARIEF
jgi:uncharacterized membrane protein (UPF0127 family)